MTERQVLIERLKKYQTELSMGYDSSTHLQMLIADLEYEELEEQSDS